MLSSFHIIENTYILILLTNPSEYSPNLDVMQYEILQTCEACLQTLLQAHLPDSLCSVRNIPRGCKNITRLSRLNTKIAHILSGIDPNIRTNAPKKEMEKTQ